MKYVLPALVLTLVAFVAFAAIANDQADEQDDGLVITTRGPGAAATYSSVPSTVPPTVPSTAEVVPSAPSVVVTAVLPTPTPIDPCSVTLQQVIDSAEPGSVLDLRNCTYTAPAQITKPLTLRGGILETETDDRWAVSLLVRSDDVTIDGWSFIGGGIVVSITDRSNVKISNNTFREHIGGSIAMWGGVENILVESNDIVNTRTRQGGIMFGRGSEGSNPCPIVGRNVTIRNNFADQGPGARDSSESVGWFGIELKCFEDVLIEGNTLRGGHVLISLPDSNRVVVRNNELDITGFTFWAVEIPKANDITIEYNTVFGDGSSSNDTAFSANSGSQKMRIRFNQVRDVMTLVNDPLNSIVTDNCLTNVPKLSAFGDPSTSTIERNGPC